MTPEEQIIAQYDEWIREVCGWRANVTRDCAGSVMLWNIRLSIPLVAMAAFAICGLWQQSTDFIVPVLLMAIPALVAVYFRQSIITEYSKITRRCDDRIDRLIAARDEIKREMKEERGY
jgi:hypothetical protein